VPSLPPAIVVVMAESRDTPAPKQEKEQSKPWTLREFAGKTVWDWLHLLSALAIPVVIALATLWFTARQNDAQRDIEAQRAKSERRIEEQRAQEAALQNYLDQMGRLILDRNLGGSTEGDAAYILARARTSTVITRLDARHNRSVARFLTEAGLTGAQDSSISVLTGADLSKADLSGAYLTGANLSGASLVDAKLSRTLLLSADLTRATFKDAALSGAYLQDAILYDTFLGSTDLSDAYLEDANLTQAYGNADFSGADLSGANLTNAAVSDKQLAECKSLKYATMPNGLQYEDWLKRKGREGAGENRGPS
jgi:uncharacterized protein YjbI with pentapeptide repeats